MGMATRAVDLPPLCMQGAFNRLDSCGWKRAFHTKRRGFTGVFASPVQDVGKQGQAARVADAFSKHPELHSRVLEKEAGDQIYPGKGLLLLFHFSCLNDGDYCLCSYLLTDIS